MNTFGMAVHSDLGKLYMADFEHTGRFTGRGTDYSGRIIRTNLDGSEAEAPDGLITGDCVWVSRIRKNRLISFRNLGSFLDVVILRNLC